MFAVNIEKFKNAKITFIFQKSLGLSIVYSKCGHEYKRIFKEEESIETLKILGLITNLKSIRKYVIMSQENISQEFRWKNIG